MHGWYPGSCACVSCASGVHIKLHYAGGPLIAACEAIHLLLAVLLIVFLNIQM